MKLTATQIRTMRTYFLEIAKALFVSIYLEQIFNTYGSIFLKAINGCLLLSSSLLFLYLALLYSSAGNNNAT